MRKSRFALAKSHIRTFFCENKRGIISCAVAFVLGVALGVAITVLEHGGQFEHVPLCDMNFGGFRVFLKFSAFELIPYIVFLFAALHFLLTLLSLSMILFVGFALGKYAVVLIMCYSLKGITNFCVIYAPALFLTFVIMSFALITVINLGECGGNPRRQSYPNFAPCGRGYCGGNCSTCASRGAGGGSAFYRCSPHRISTIVLKPSVKFLIICYGVNVGVNFFIFVFLGLFVPVIVI
jgi:hypothetical protein